MSNKISDLPVLAPPIAAADLLAIVDASTSITKSIRGDQALLYSKTSIATGAVLTLNGTPVELVALPGAGKVIVPIMVGLSLTWAAAAYDTNTTLQLIYDTGTGFTLDTAILLKTADHILTRFVDIAPTEGLIQNKKLSITVGTGNPGTGDSALDVYTWYQILTL
ncbi:hypothetical protein LCGC14_1883200 [marine sediment metagenome]|uniref:Uncharacterized protein n=1 Tax=marine sediment metagenome TaxID=412755 RepID=A0A0F9G1Q7_9ZZZZ